MALGGPPGYHLYVARFTDGDVAVLDSATGEEISRIDLGFGSNPVEVLSSPDHRTVYVCKRGDDEIVLIDTRTRKVRAAVKVGMHPNFMDFSRDGRYLIVANNQDDHASVIDMKSLGVVSEPRIGLGSSGVAVTQDNRYAYITSIYADMISVIDLGTMDRTLTIGYTSPMAIVIPSGSHLAYFCSHRDRISILDTRTNKVVGHIKVGDTPNYITLSHDGRTAFVTNGLSDTVSVVDLKRRRVIKEIAVGREPFSSRLSPDGRFLFVANHNDGPTDGSISVIDVEALKEVDRIELRRNPRAIAVIPAN